MCTTAAGQLQEPAEFAAALRVQHHPNGVTVCGSLIGMDKYVASVLGERQADTKMQVDELMRPPRQSQFVRTSTWAQLKASTQDKERVIQDAVAAIYRLPKQGAARSASR